MRLGVTVLLALVTHTLCWWPISSKSAPEAVAKPAAETEVAEPPAEVAEAGCG